jgi:hypothetical protein
MDDDARAALRLEFTLFCSTGERARSRSGKKCIGDVGRRPSWLTAIHVSRSMHGAIVYAHCRARDDGVRVAARIGVAP